MLIGEYQDRRNGDKINCSKTIWILATNALDNTILDFCEDNDAITGDDGDEKSRQVRKLSQQLRESFLQQFGVSPACIPFPQYALYVANLGQAYRHLSLAASQISFPYCPFQPVNKLSSHTNAC